MKIPVKPHNQDHSPTWTGWHTTAVVLFVVAFVTLGVLATQLKTTRHNHFGFWSGVIVGLLLILLMIIAGHGLAGRWDGILIDGRNRISLSQFQLVIWTIVVLASFAGAFVTNLLGDVAPIKALTVSIPPELWVALGISAATLAGSAGLNTKHATEPPHGALPSDLLRAEETGVEARGKLLVKASIRDASWGDLFASDYVQDAGRADVAKAQMFFFTVVLAFGYTVAVANLLLAPDLPVNELPKLDSGFVTLLAVSQGGYLTTKTLKGS